MLDKPIYQNGVENDFTILLQRKMEPQLHVSWYFCKARTLAISNLVLA
jgi:hypothetical protein